MLDSEQVHKSLIHLGVDVEPGKNQPSYAYEHSLGGGQYLYVKRKKGKVLNGYVLLLSPAMKEMELSISSIVGLNVNWDVPRKSTSYRKYPKWNGEDSRYGFEAEVQSVEALAGLLEQLNVEKVTSYPRATQPSIVNKATIMPAINQILYGPPGTGKTWSTTEYAVRLADPGFYAELSSQELDADGIRDAMQKHYQALCEDGRIVFTTFHQSFSYEDFVEGIRAVVDEETQELSYKVQPGVFRELAERAGKAVGRSGGLQLAESPRVWKLSIGRTADKALREQYVENGEARIGWNNTGDLNEEYDDRSADEQAYFDKLKQNARSTVLDFSENMQVGDVVLCLKDKSTIQHVGIVSSDYFFDPLSSTATPHYAHARKVNWVLKDIDFKILRLNNNKALTLKTCYQLKRISWDDLVGELAKQGYGLNDVDGTSEEKPNYVLIIDEINRGNISRIFGELITLLEPDKRKGASDAREVVLPYSKELFSVPGNLHILGTMNTADKSLAQLDLALRRRFEFVELLPDPQKLAGVTVHGIAVSELLNVLNQRIEVLLDRDHTIGHAYFWALHEAKTEEERQRLLAQIFDKRVIPLLQEYFFADWERIGWVLNDPAKAYDVRFIQIGQVGTSVANLFSGDLSSEINDRRYQINQSAFSNPASYISILTAAEPTEG